jgi:hypothetical protein
LEGQLTVPHADLHELAHPVALLQRIGTLYIPLQEAAERARETWRAALRHEVTADHGQLVDLLLDASAVLQRNKVSTSVAELRQQYLAQLIAIFIPRYLRHFRLFVLPVLVGSMLGVLMTSLYFLQPQRLITSVIFVWVAGMVCGSFAVYTSLDRSPVISAIGKTTEGSVDFDWTLFTRLVSWGIVPLFSLLAAQYPDFGYWVSLLVNGLGKSLR